MKSKDIKPGTVYAHQARKYAVEPIVFLGPADSDHLYRDANHRSWHNSGVAYRRHEQATKPAANSTHYGPIGWAAATVDRNADHAALTGVTLADFEAATKSTTDNGVRFLLVTGPAKILGEYDEVMAAEQAERDAHEAARERAEAAAEARRDRTEAQVKALKALGINASREYSTGHTGYVSFSPADVDKLLRLLADGS